MLALFNLSIENLIFRGKRATVSEPNKFRFATNRLQKQARCPKTGSQDTREPRNWKNENRLPSDKFLNRWRRVQATKSWKPEKREGSGGPSGQAYNGVINYYNVVIKGKTWNSPTGFTTNISNGAAIHANPSTNMPATWGSRNRLFRPGSTAPD